MRHPARLVLALAALAGPLAGQAPVVDPPIHPGDVVLLEVWKEEELTGEFIVDNQYRVTLPLVGEIDVRGETELSLRRHVREVLRQQLRNPSIQVFVLKRVRVMGEVLEPGVFHIDSTQTVADALAMAGGRTPQASRGDVELRRRGETVRSDVNVDSRLGELRVETGDEIIVLSSSWISRNAAPLVTGLAGIVGGVIVSLIVN